MVFKYDIREKHLILTSKHENFTEICSWYNNGCGWGNPTIEYAFL